MFFFVKVLHTPLLVKGIIFADVSIISNDLSRDRFYKQPTVPGSDIALNLKHGVSIFRTHFKPDTESKYRHRYELQPGQLCPIPLRVASSNSLNFLLTQFCLIISHYPEIFFYESLNLFDRRYSILACLGVLLGATIQYQIYDGV